MVEVHEDWLLHRVEHFRPAPSALTGYESRTIVGFRWWSIEDLSTTAETVFPPGLGQRLSSLLENGVPPIPIDITAGS